MLLIVIAGTARAQSLPGDLRSHPLVAPKDQSTVDANDFGTLDSAVLADYSLNEQPRRRKRKLPRHLRGKSHLS